MMPRPSVIQACANASGQDADGMPRTAACATAASPAAIGAISTPTRTNAGTSTGLRRAPDQSRAPQRPCRERRLADAAEHGEQGLVEADPRSQVEDRDADRDAGQPAPAVHQQHREREAGEPGRPPASVP